MAEQPAIPSLDPAQNQAPRRSRPWTTLVAIGALALGKLKALLVLLKALPFAKLLLTSGTMLASIFVYARMSGWAFATGFVLMILIHELGHGFAIRSHGLHAGFPVFIPFFGALIALKGQPRTPLVEAEIAIAGPVAGALASVGVTLIFFVTRNPLYLALGHVGFLLNLFNLTPFGALDGGRVAALFSRKAWIAGAVILAALFAVTRTPQLVLIALLSLPHVLRRSKAPPVGDDLVTPSERLNMAYHYFGLCVFLAAGMYLSQRLLNPS